MRRPIAFITMAFSIGIFANYILKFQLAILLNLVLIVALIFYIIPISCTKLSENFRNNNQKVYICVFCIFFISGGLLFQVNNNSRDLLSEQEGEVVEVKGIIKDIKRYTTDYGIYYKAILAAEKIIKNSKTDLIEDLQIEDLQYVNREKIKTQMTIIGNIDLSKTKFANYHELLGQKIIVKGRISLPTGRRNPNTFNYKMYMKTNNINTLLECEWRDVFFVGENEAILLNTLGRIKGRFISIMEKNLSEETRTMLEGMIFGNKSELSGELYETFQRNGTAHILAISGLHMGVIYACLNQLIGKHKNMAYYFIVVIVLVCYCIMTGSSPSVIRAASMIILHIVSKLVRKRYDILSAASFVALINLIANPHMLFNTGFELSYLAILSIAVLLPIFSRGHWKMIASTMTMQIGMAPITAYFFNYFSLGAFFANPPVIFFTGILLPYGMFTMLCSYVINDNNLIMQINFSVLEKLNSILIYVNDFFYANGKTTTNVVSPNIFFLCIFYGFLFLGCTELVRIQWLRKKYKNLWKLVILVVVFSVIVSFGYDQNNKFRDCQIVFVDVGQGDCLHIKTLNGKNILIDSGGSTNKNVGKKVLLPYLLKNGVDKIDMVIITHLHSDHYQGIVDLKGQIEIEKLCIFEGYRNEEDKISLDTGIKKENIIYVKKGDCIFPDESTDTLKNKKPDKKSCWIEVLYPQSFSNYTEIIENLKERDENEMSLILKVHYNDLSILMTADLTGEGEKKLCKTYGYSGNTVLKCDVLKVSHHGSRYSSTEEFLTAVSPVISVIQVGKNNFGHPHMNTIEKFQKRDIMIYRNDLQGAVGLTYNKHYTKITTMIDKE